MAEIPDEAKKRFDRAYENVNPGPASTATGPRDIVNATRAAATTQVNLAEGLIIGVLTAQEGLSKSLDAFTASTNQSSEALVFWTKVLAILTGVLALFALMQVLVTVCWSSDFC